MPWRGKTQANDEFERTSFLYGGNADYIEELHARYKDDPQFGRRGLARILRRAEGRRQEDVDKNAARRFLAAQAGWPVSANGELVSALDGNWGTVEKHVAEQAARKRRSPPASRADSGGDATRRRAIRCAPS